MIDGGCLCGGIRYEAEQTAGPMAACHCQMCRKAHGSAYSIIQPVQRAGFRWLTGEDLLTAEAIAAIHSVSQQVADVQGVETVYSILDDATIFARRVARAL